MSKKLKQKTIILGWSIAVMWVLLFASVSNAQDSLNMRRVGRITFPDTVTISDFVIQGNYAFMTLDYEFLQNYYSQFRILDLTNPLNPQWVGHCTITRSNHIQILGNHAYIADAFGLSVVNITQIDSPYVEGVYHHIYSGQRVAVTPQCVFLNLGFAIYAISISNPATPQLLSTCYTTDISLDMEIRGNYLYSTHAGTGFDIINISNPDSIFLSNVINGLAPYGLSDELAINGHFLFLHLDLHSTKLINISNSTVPVVVSQLSTYDWAIHTRGQDYVAMGTNFAGTRGWVISYDISNLPTMQLRASYEVTEPYSVFSKHNNYIYAIRFNIIDIYEQTIPNEIIENESRILPVDFYVSAYPNPFNPTTNFRVDIPKNTHIKVLVFDYLGRLVTTVANQEVVAGRYNFQWNGSRVASGIYFVIVKTNEFSSTRKMILLK